MTADLILFAFIFAFGCCIGSFLNVVVYRLPRDKSLIIPPSTCPACGQRIKFYDNIPIISWLILRTKCRYCKAPISSRYFFIELLTGLLFSGLFYLYFFTNLRAGLSFSLRNVWLIYLLHIILLASLIAASAIDLELWVIPLTVCWFATFVGLASSTIGVYVIDPNIIRGYSLLPSASAATGSLAAGAGLGLGISWILLTAGIIKRSYEPENSSNNTESQETGQQEQYDHRSEMNKEILFLLPIVICSLVTFAITAKIAAVRNWWVDFSQVPAVAGFLGSLWGYFVGCGVIWLTRLLGTLAFGKEAMGMGDVHLMGAAGAVIGPVLVIVAFFIAPFFGLAWAGFQMFSKKTRQIPYGPFLSLGVLTVMILHDRIFGYLVNIFYRT